MEPRNRFGMGAQTSSMSIRTESPVKEMELEPIDNDEALRVTCAAPRSVIDHRPPRVWYNATFIEQWLSGSAPGRVPRRAPRRRAHA